MSRDRTHHLGVKCAECEGILVEDDCCEGHGYFYQYPSPWAAQTWPDHGCFEPPQDAYASPTDFYWDDRAKLHQSPG